MQIQKTQYVISKIGYGDIHKYEDLSTDTRSLGALIKHY